MLVTVIVTASYLHPSIILWKNYGRKKFYSACHRRSHNKELWLQDEDPAWVKGNEVNSRLNQYIVFYWV